MTEYSALPYHNFQVSNESISSELTEPLESDENEDELNKEQVGLLESHEDNEEHEKQIYSEEFNEYLGVRGPAYTHFLSTISSLFKKPTSSSVKSHVLSYILALLPSFLLPLFGQSTPRKLHPTSYLDGLRGFAALFVVFDHIKLQWPGRFASMDLGFHSTPDPSQSSLLIQFPIVRILYNGQGMVAIFFVVSGYALSYKPLKLIRKRDSAALLDSMASMIFRRHMRLYLPLIFTTFIAMCLGYLGAFPDNWVPAFPGQWKLQVWDWWTKFVWMADPFRPIILQHGFGDAFPYDRNLWTIPIEFRGSMVVFLTLISLAKVRPAIRMLLITSLTAFCFYYAIWDLFLFLAGLLIADIHFGMNKETPPSFAEEIYPAVSSQSRKSFWELYWKKMKPILAIPFWLTIFFFALFILGFPVKNPEDSPGFETLNSWIPQHWSDDVFWRRFWSGNGAVLLVFCVGCAKFLQYPFTTSFGQYLGRISFSLYMTHGTWLHTFGARTFPYFSNNLGHIWGLVVWMIVFFISLIWLADLIMRGVDEKCVAFTRWMAGICVKKSEERV